MEFVKFACYVDLTRKKRRVGCNGIYICNSPDLRFYILKKKIFCYIVAIWLGKTWRGAALDEVYVMRLKYIIFMFMS